MNPLALSVILLNAVALLVLPRRWAPLPLLAGTCYMTLGQGIDVGPLSFTALRILVAVGVLRVVLRGERWSGGLNGLDWLMVMWSVWAIASSPFHQEEGALTFRFGLVYNAAGIYFLLRVFCTSLDDVKLLCRMTAFVLIPVAVEMLYERIAFHNLFSVFGGVPDVPQLREGKIRAFGPFSHPILAGTVGAVCLPLMAGLWHQQRRTAILGIAVCVSIVLSSASSGPFMSAVFAVAALWMWRFREHMRQLRWAAVCLYLLLNTFMKVPAYYLIARIDVVGGSTGYHRARLIESALEHLGEWWMVGTDYTRHWMPTGVSWSPNHTDITNHYLYMGVLAGLPLMLLFISVLARAFSYVGQALRRDPNAPVDHQFFAWALGSALFAHAATCVSVSYFDQSFLFLYLVLAAIASIWAYVPAAKAVLETAAPQKRDRAFAPGRLNPAWSGPTAGLRQRRISAQLNRAR
jgi:hypothetical protein